MMLNPLGWIARYTHWLHTQWPSGQPEPLPIIGERGATKMRRVRIAGDLLGIPLLKFATQSGADAIRAFGDDGIFWSVTPPGTEELVIVGAGISGISAALEAKANGVQCRVLDASEPFATIVNFSKGKPIFTYPTNMVPESPLVIEGNSRETLLENLRRQLVAAQIPVEKKRVLKLTRGRGAMLIHVDGEEKPIRAKAVLLCVGRSGNFRRLNVPGEDLDKVSNRLFDPADYKGRKLLVVGGGDAACEAVIETHKAGAEVSLSVRASDLSRAKPDIVEDVMRRIGDRVMFSTEVTEIRDQEVLIRNRDGSSLSLPNDNVLKMIGREPPTEFMRRSGFPLARDWTFGRIMEFITAFSVIFFLYNWKNEGGWLSEIFRAKNWFPFHLDTDPWAEYGKVAEIFAPHFKSPGFYYELLYTVVISIFGVKRILRHRTPYITRQTLSLMLVQMVPLFLLPYLILPLMEHWGAFKSGSGLWIADQLFPIPDEGAPREYWRSVGFILAWPLFIWNVFTAEPNKLWLGISLFQTFVLIPWIVIRFGKGAYCGWICSCGAMAETLGDAHRTKMPHGPIWNRVNMLGQVILAFAFALLALRVGSWVLGSEHPIGSKLENWFVLMAVELKAGPVALSYSSFVDFFLSGIVGMGLYFHFSGRTWCRFACPLAALMHIYARFTKFRIFPDKKKCISCNACTTACHQGIDVMNFANKGRPMEDPECVRCSACVTVCPTGTLTFGHLGRDGNPIYDGVLASPVQIREKALAKAAKEQEEAAHAAGEKSAT